MMKKKSMAVAMAAVTVAMPMSQSFAAVVDNTQTEEIKAMKAKVLDLMNKKFTKDANLLKHADKADKNVFKVELTTPNATEECANYADFERKFDKAYARLEDGQSIKIAYDYAQTFTDTADGNKVKSIGYFTLEDGSIVDFEPKKYDKADLEDLTTSNTPKVGEVKSTELNSDGTKKYEVRLSNESSKTDALHRYSEIKAGDFMMDFTKPVIGQQNDYYLDVDGKSIASVEDGDTVKLYGVDANGIPQVGIFREGTAAAADFTFTEDANSLKLTNPAINGFYVDANKADAAKTPTITKDVITKQGAQNVTLNSSDLFNSNEGRVTSEGNELVRKLKELSYNLYDVTYTVDKKETSVDKEMTIKVYKQDEGATQEGKIAEIKIVRDDKDTKAEAYRAIKEIVMNANYNEKIRVAAGADRYETAAEVSRMHFNKTEFAKTNEKAIVLVTGSQDKLVDGLTATPLAASLNKVTENVGSYNKDDIMGAPVLLTGNDKIAKPVLDEINRLGAQKVYIVGGAISETVEKQLEDVHGLEVDRVSGDDRYDTALEVAEKMLEVNKTAKVDTAFVVGGKGEADALSVASAAAREKAPILLTNADKLNKDVKYFLETKFDVTPATDYDKVYVVGGKSSVSEKAYNDTLDVVGKGNIDRLSGDNRQDTNADVVEEFFKTPQSVVVAKSDNNGMVDALGAGLYAGLKNAPVILATNNLTDDQEDYLNDKTSISKTEDKKVMVGNGISSTIAKFVKGLNTRK